MMKIEFLLLGLSLGASIAFAGSATHSADDAAQVPVVELRPDTSALEKRVSSRWDSLIAKDFARAYEYFSPTFRKLFPLESYLRGTGTNVEWSSIDVQNISVDGNRAEVEVLLRYRVTLPPQAGFDLDSVGLIDKNIDEVWLWKGGNWWYVELDDGRL